MSFDKLYTALYLMYRRIYQSRALKYEICRLIAAQSFVSTIQVHLEIFAAHSMEPRCCYVFVPVGWSAQKMHRTLYVPILSVLTYCTGASEEHKPCLDRLAIDSAATKFTIELFAWFIQAAEIGLVNLFSMPRKQAIMDGRYVIANDHIFISLQLKSKTKILELGLVRSFSDCKVSFLYALLASAWAWNVHWTRPNYSD